VVVEALQVILPQLRPELREREVSIPEDHCREVLIDARGMDHSRVEIVCTPDVLDDTSASPLVYRRVLAEERAPVAGIDKAEE